MLQVLLLFKDEFKLNYFHPNYGEFLEGQVRVSPGGWSGDFWTEFFSGDGDKSSQTPPRLITMAKSSTGVWKSSSFSLYDIFGVAMAIDCKTVNNFLFKCSSWLSLGKETTHAFCVASVSLISATRFLGDKQIDGHGEGQEKTNYSLSFALPYARPTRTRWRGKRMAEVQMTHFWLPFPTFCSLILRNIETFLRCPASGRDFVQMSHPSERR